MEAVGLAMRRSLLGPALRTGYFATLCWGGVVIAAGGGIITKLASGHPAWAIAVDATSVYWTNRGTYGSRGALNGCTGAVMKLCPK